MTSNNKPDLDEYAMVVFTLPFESVFVESLFSMMNYNKNRYRASLLDESVSNVMHAKAVKSVVADPHVPFEADFELMKTAPLEHKLFFWFATCFTIKIVVFSLLLQVAGEIKCHRDPDQLSMPYWILKIHKTLIWSLRKHGF